MKQLVKVGVLTALIVAPGMALAFRAWNRSEVTPIGNGVFEVVNYFGSAPRDYWCGAGDYGIRVLRLKGNERIYLWNAVGPSVSQPGKKGVQFSLQAPEGADTTPGYSLTVKRVGDNLSASMAQGYCYDNLTDDLWLR